MVGAAQVPGGDARVSTALLVTGGRGQLGADLVAAAARAGIAEVRPPGSAELDVTDPAAVRAAVRALAGAGGSAVVVNAAAYTAVDAAECDPERAFAVNATGPTHLAAAVRWYAENREWWEPLKSPVATPA